jgi:hypothetical protein
MLMCIGHPCQWQVMPMEERFIVHFDEMAGKLDVLQEMFGGAIQGTEF